MNNTVDERQEKDKALLIEQLRIMPIIQVACHKSGLSRATYYRWRHEDLSFAANADAAIKDGVLFINDLAESKLIKRIDDEDMTAIIYWLKHHHLDYKPKPNLTLGPDKNGQNNKKLVLSWEDEEKIQKE